MAKLALLIGVSEYENPGLTSLLGSAKDVEAMQRVLQHPELGGFAEVKTLPNPEPLAMQEAIENLFSGRTKDDLVVLFFSGHGIKDERGRLYLATRITRKNAKGELIKATAVPASFVQDMIGNSRSKRKVVILDCCFSGAFAEGLLLKDDGSVDVRNQLGGEGCAVLTSSTSTQYSFQQEGSNLSTYTRYLVEGIETGAADTDNDGIVSVDELHDYAKNKVQEAAPAMKPEIYAIKEGYKIWLAQVATDDPKSKYRREVERCVNNGEISLIGRRILDNLQFKLGLLSEEVKAIEAEVLKPHQEYKQKLHQYELAWDEAIKREQTLSDYTRNQLRRYQEILGLRNEDVAPIKARIAVQPESVPTSAQLISSPEPAIVTKNKDATAGKISAQPLVPTASETPTSSQTQLPSHISTSVSVIRNPKLLMGAGVATAVALTSYLLVTSQPKFTNSPTPAPTPTQSASVLGSAKEYFDRGMNKFNNQDYKGAIADFDQSLQLDSNYTLAYYQRGQARSENGEYKEAIEDFNKYLQFNPNHVEANRFRGWAYYKLGNYQQAISNYNKVIEIDPNHSDAYYNRGLAYAEQGNYQPAISDYSKAIEINPQSVNSYYYRGWAYYKLGNYQPAISDYSKAIEINPQSVNSYYYRGWAYHKLGNYQQAISNYNKVIEIDPNHSDAYYNRGLAYAAQGNYQPAISDYSKAIEINPKGMNIYYKRGLAYAEQGNYQQAISDYSKAIELKYDPLTNAYNSRGRAKDDLKDYNAAIEDYTQAILLEPNEASAYYNRGLTRVKLGDKPQAIKDFQKAAELYQQKGKIKDYQDALNQLKQLQQ